MFGKRLKIDAFPESAFRTSPSAGSGFLSSRALDDSTTPGMQNPH